MRAGFEERQLSGCVRPDAATRLRQFRHDVERRFPGEVTAVVLFGSRARGDARRDSDYDVAIFFKGLAHRRPIHHALADLAYPHILAGVHIRPVALPDSDRSGPKPGALSLAVARDGLNVV